MSRPDGRNSPDDAAFSLRRGALSRTAKLLALPAGAAGRAGLRFGRRISGTDAETAANMSREQAAEQLFRVLGELKGGAMKAGQALSIFESAMPEEVAGPYRERMRRLQDSAPPMPASRVHAIMAAEFGTRWRDRFTSFQDRPAAAASIGQVHRGVWAATGGPVAVKLQYPGADEALATDLRQISRVATLFAPLFGGVDVRPLMSELVAKVGQETDYAREAAMQQRAAEGFAGHPDFVVPEVREHTARVMISDWLDGVPLSRATELPDAERNAMGLRYVRFLFAGPRTVGLLHGDPHPGNFKMLPDGRLGIVDFGLVDEMPAGLPEAMGRVMSWAAAGDAEAMLAGLRAEGFVSASDISAEAVLEYLSPFIEPALVDEFHFCREWMRREFQRVNSATGSDGETAGVHVAKKLNLPPSYLLIHRVWLGGIAVLSQMDVRADFASVLEEFLPGWHAPA